MRGQSRVSSWARHQARTIIVISLVSLTIVPGPLLGTQSDTDVIGVVPLSESSDAVRAAAPSVEIPSGILLSMDGTVLWSRAVDEERAMASTTKIMTCLIALEETDPDDTVTVSARAAAVGGSGIYLREGERQKVGDLLLAMMLESSNTAAHAIAEHVAGSLTEFVGLMNERAEEMGLTGTSYGNPHGLDTAGHHTTARDLAVLARAAMEVDEFRTLVETDEATIPGPSGGVRDLENSNLLIGEYEGANGIKTGWTTPAGYCLVASASKGSVDLVSVVLGAQDESSRFEQSEALLDWGFLHYAPTTLVSVGETVAALPITDYLDREVDVAVSQTLEQVVFDLAGGLSYEYEMPVDIDAPVEAGQRVGTVRVFQGDEVLAETGLVAVQSVPEPTLWERVAIFFTRIWRGWFGEPELSPAGA